MTHTAVLSLGSNWGDREAAVSNALVEIVRLVGTTRPSDIYFCPPLNGKGPDYANCVVAVTTGLDAAALVRVTKEMEVAAGRSPQSRERGEVPLDIDVVIYDGTVLRPADFEREYFKTGYRQIVP